MRFSKTIVLKNGKSCLVRNAEEFDGKSVLESFNLTHSQTEYLLSYPDENYFTEAQESLFLKKKAESENEIELVAVIDNVVVGTAGVEAIGSKYKIMHRAEFGISVLKEFWGLGIGTALLEACIECARLAGYTQLELNVVSDNEPAIAMYKKAGFIEFGRNPKGFNSRTLGFQELVYMRLEL